MYRFMEENSATVHKSYDLVRLITKFVHTCIFEQPFAVDFHYINYQFRNFESDMKKKIIVFFFTLKFDNYAICILLKMSFSMDVECF